MSNSTMPPNAPGDGDFPVDSHSCKLLGPTALVVQGLMGVLVLLSLAYKRQREEPKRPWRIWLFDVSKQIVGQMFVHGANVLVSDLVSHHSSSNACVFYFLNILIDTTLGVAIIYLVLRILTYTTIEKFQWNGFQSGVYGTPPSISYWARQTALYIVALGSMKFIVVLLLALFPGLDKIAAWLLSWTLIGSDDSVQVIFTMGLFPIIMNILQFWLIDSIVKANQNTLRLSLDSSLPDSLHDADREPLFDAPSDDEDDFPPQRYDIENPRTLSPSPSSQRSVADKTVTVTPENKSSGSGTSGQAIQLHDYPPSMSSSIASLSSSSSAPIKEATKLGRKQAKLNLTPRPSRPPSAAGQRAPPPEPTQAPNVPSNNDWDNAWGDDADDWNPAPQNVWETNKTVSVSS